MLAVLTVTDVWQPDLKREAEAVYGTADARKHPGVALLYQNTGACYVGGRLEGIHFSPALRLYPSAPDSGRTEPGVFRTGLASGHRVSGQHARCIACTRKCCWMRQWKPGPSCWSAPLSARVSPPMWAIFPWCAVTNTLSAICPRNAAMLNLSPIRHRGAGPRGALLHAMINRNYGCTHFYGSRAA